MVCFIYKERMLNISDREQYRVINGAWWQSVSLGQMITQMRNWQSLNVVDNV